MDRAKNAVIPDFRIYTKPQSYKQQKTNGTEQKASEEASKSIAN